MRPECFNTAARGWKKQSSRAKCRIVGDMAPLDATVADMATGEGEKRGAGLCTDSSCSVSCIRLLSERERCEKRRRKKDCVKDWRVGAERTNQHIEPGKESEGE
eukprot:1129505-Rhodomonas_salina.3